MFKYGLALTIDIYSTHQEGLALTIDIYSTHQEGLALTIDIYSTHQEEYSIQHKDVHMSMALTLGQSFSISISETRTIIDPPHNRALKSTIVCCG